MVRLTRRAFALTTLVGLSGCVNPLDPQNQVVWKSGDNEPTDSRFTSSLTHAGSAIYYANTQGEIGSVDVSDGTQNWRVTVEPRLLQPPTIRSGLLYVGSTGVHAFSLTGSRRFSAPLDNAAITSSAPLITTDESVVFGTNEGDVIAIDAKSGEEHWRTSISEDSIFWWTASSKNGYFLTRNGIVVSLGLHDGSEQWQVQVASPARLAVANGGLYVGGNDVFCIDTTDGTERWRFTDVPAYVRRPVAHGEQVYVSAGTEGSRGWVGAFETSSGELRWSTELKNPITTAPAVDEGVYIGDSAGNLFTLDKNGDIAWSYNVGSELQTTPVVVESLVVFGTANGNMYALERRTG